MGGAAEEAVRDTTRNQVFLTQKVTSAVTADPASNPMPRNTEITEHKALRVSRHTQRRNINLSTRPRDLPRQVRPWEAPTKPPHQQCLSTKCPYSCHFFLLAWYKAAEIRTAEQSMVCTVTFTCRGSLVSNTQSHSHRTSRCALRTLPQTHLCSGALPRGREMKAGMAHGG